VSLPVPAKVRSYAKRTATATQKAIQAGDPDAVRKLAGKLSDYLYARERAGDIDASEASAVRAAVGLTRTAFDTAEALAADVRSTRRAEASREARITAAEEHRRRYPWKY